MCFCFFILFLKMGLFRFIPLLLFSMMVLMGFEPQALPVNWANTPSIPLILRFIPEVEESWTSSFPSCFSDLGHRCFVSICQILNAPEQWSNLENKWSFVLSICLTLSLTPKLSSATPASIPGEFWTHDLRGSSPMLNHLNHCQCPSHPELKSTSEGW